MFDWELSSQSYHNTNYTGLEGESLTNESILFFWNGVTNQVNWLQFPACDIAMRYPDGISGVVVVYPLLSTLLENSDPSATYVQVWTQFVLNLVDIIHFCTASVVDAVEVQPRAFCIYLHLNCFIICFKLYVMVVTRFSVRQQGLASKQFVWKCNVL